MQGRDGFSKSVSGNDLSVYFDASCGDPQRAQQLYVWNIKLCASFYSPLQIVEIGIRNAFEEQLKAHFGSDWANSREFLGIDFQLHKAIYEAKVRLVRLRPKNAQNTTRFANAEIVSQLSFGFWNLLLAAHLTDSVWIPALRKAFPGYNIINSGRNLAREAAAQRIHQMRVFRNRVFHHEPIFARSARKDFERMRTFCSWISVELLNWFDTQTSECASLTAIGLPS